MCGVNKVSKQKLIPSVCFLLNNKIIYFYVIYFLGKNNKHSQNVNKFSEKYIKDDKLFDWNIVKPKIFFPFLREGGFQYFKWNIYYPIYSYDSRTDRPIQKIHF